MSETAMRFRVSRLVTTRSSGFSLPETSLLKRKKIPSRVRLVFELLKLVAVTVGGILRTLNPWCMYSTTAGALYRRSQIRRAMSRAWVRNAPMDGFPPIVALYACTVRSGSSYLTFTRRLVLSTFAFHVSQLVVFPPLRN